MLRTATASVAVSATLLVAFAPVATATTDPVPAPSVTATIAPAPDAVATPAPTAAETTQETAAPVEAAPGTESAPVTPVDGNAPASTPAPTKAAPKTDKKAEAKKEELKKTETTEAASGAAAESNPVTGAAAFSDISGSGFQADINWMEQEGITNGWANADGTRSFKPEQSISRDAMAAFLYRMAGSPAYTAPADSKFADVPQGRAFYKEIHWMADIGVTNGWASSTGKPSFKPDAPVSRDQMAAFLFRFSNSQDTYTYVAPTTSPFKDVSTTSAFYKEMSWLREKGISNGWSNSDGTRTYLPGSSITREAMAAFLHRLDTNVGVSAETAADWDTEIIDGRL